MSYLLCIELVTWAEDFIFFFLLCAFMSWKKGSKTHRHTLAIKQLVWVSLFYLFFPSDLIPVPAIGFSSPNNKLESGNGDTHLVPPHTGQISTRAATCLPLFPSLAIHLPLPWCPLLCILRPPCFSPSYLWCTSVLCYSPLLGWMVLRLQPERLIMLLEGMRVFGASVQQLCGAGCVRCIKPPVKCNIILLCFKSQSFLNNRLLRKLSFFFFFGSKYDVFLHWWDAT